MSSLNAAQHARLEQVRRVALAAIPLIGYIPTRWPATYAADFLRSHPELLPDNVEVSWDTGSRGSTLHAIRCWADADEVPVAALKAVLADAYLVEHHIPLTDAAHERAALHGLHLPPSQPTTDLAPWSVVCDRCADHANTDAGSRCGRMVDALGIDDDSPDAVPCTGTYRALSAPGAPLLDPDLRGRTQDGLTPETANSVLGQISDATGLRLVCVWEHYDQCGPGGGSNVYVEPADGAPLRELAGDLWPWLSGDPDDPTTPTDPGHPTTWVGEATDLRAEDMTWSDDFHNHAITDAR